MHTSHTLSLSKTHLTQPTNIEAQELLIKKTKLEMALYRLEVCSKMAQSGAVLVGKHAVTCEDVKLIARPNQVLPHKHSIK